MTKRQAEILNFIRRCVRDNGFPPTLQEICREFGFSSTNGATSTLRALERKGHLRRSYRGASRGLILAEPAIAPAAKQTASRNLVIIAARAASPTEAFMQPQGIVALDTALFALTDASFAARAGDFAMKSAGIFKDDLVIARRDAAPAEGDLVVALTGGAVVVREWRKGAKFPELRATVRTFPSYPANEFNPILGVVTGVLRSFVRVE